MFEIAKSLKIDPEKLKSDMNSEDVAAILENDRDLFAWNGFRGTPGLIIGKERVGGVSTDEMIAIVDSQLPQIAVESVGISDRKAVFESN